MMQITKLPLKETLSKPFHSCVVGFRARAAAGTQKYAIVLFCAFLAMRSRTNFSAFTPAFQFHKQPIKITLNKQLQSPQVGDYFLTSFFFFPEQQTVVKESQVVTTPFISYNLKIWEQRKNPRGSSTFLLIYGLISHWDIKLQSINTLILSNLSKQSPSKMKDKSFASFIQREILSKEHQYKGHLYPLCSSRFHLNKQIYSLV